MKNLYRPISILPLKNNKTLRANKLPALTNLGMGYAFEELILALNEENNEEAGEHLPHAK